MKKKIFLLPLPILAIILELLPYGAVLNFADPENALNRKTFSYFSITPFGYANFGPFITAILSCILLALVLVYIKTEKCGKVIKIISVSSFVASILPLFLGITYFSAVGAAISVVLAAEACLALFTKIK